MPFRFSQYIYNYYSPRYKPVTSSISILFLRNPVFICIQEYLFIISYHFLQTYKKTGYLYSQKFSSFNHPNAIIVYIHMVLLPYIFCKSVRSPASMGIIPQISATSYTLWQSGSIISRPNFVSPSADSLCIQPRNVVKSNQTYMYYRYLLL